MFRLISNFWVYRFQSWFIPDRACKLRANLPNQLLVAIRNNRFVVLDKVQFSSIHRKILRHGLTIVFYFDSKYFEVLSQFKGHWLSIWIHEKSQMCFSQNVPFFAFHQHSNNFRVWLWKLDLRTCKSPTLILEKTWKVYFQTNISQHSFLK